MAVRSLSLRTVLMCVEPTRSAYNITKFALDSLWELPNFQYFREKCFLLLGSFNNFRTLALLSAIAVKILVPFVAAMDSIKPFLISRIAMTVTIIITIGDS
jgi:hypothetical protein